ncbi:protein MKS1 [Prunus yedoensis var. nudiflora]|uniref:Protein MKS1 n=1 Tax=Prunus yedoensis var. nudiflora TaxID=2094558 RepID=A0A314UX44_PRUYE|nr:protein MKS1 [Prunus yedoensis var. nudiflora]
MDYSAGKSPKRELQLQGPRPTPLRVHKDSHKIKKPPIVPQPSSQPPSQQPHLYQQPRQPVIIYTVSPKVIHTNPSDFMDLVQRLTGLNSSSSSSPPTQNNPNNPPNYDNNNNNNSRDDQVLKTSSAQDVAQGMEMDDDDGGVRQKGLFPGILSPGPSSLNPIPSNFFSPPSDSFFHDLSPVLYGNRNFIEGSFMPSPSNFFSPSTPSIDLFNNFPDL